MTKQKVILSKQKANGIKPDVIGLAVKGAAVRVIKFRAWHKEEKVLCKVETLTGAGAFLIGVKKGKDQIQDRMIVYAPDDGRFCENTEIELMQYIGLNDINGKNIYEGDIVKWGHIKGGEENPIRIAIVKVDPDIQFELIPTDEYKRIFREDKHTFPYGSFIYTDTENWLEIIGNIYESAGLLAAAPLTACR